MEENTQEVEQITKENLTRETLEGAIKGQQQAAEDVAAAFFTLEQPRLRMCIDQMSQNELRRLLYNLVSYPHVKPGQELKNEIEKKAFYLADQMIMNKFTMQLAFEMQKAEEAQKREELKQQETSTEEKTDGQV